MSRKRFIKLTPGCSCQTCKLLCLVLFTLIYFSLLYLNELIIMPYFFKFKLAGDKEDRDAKLRQMADELKKLKNKLGRQEKLEDEVYYLIHRNL